jgi:hypothetical protein
MRKRRQMENRYEPGESETGLSRGKRRLGTSHKMEVDNEPLASKRTTHTSTSSREVNHLQQLDGDLDELSTQMSETHISSVRAAAYAKALEISHRLNRRILYDDTDEIEDLARDIYSFFEA